MAEKPMRSLLNAWVDEDGKGYYLNCTKCHFYKNALSSEGDPCRHVGCAGKIERVNFVTLPASVPLAVVPSPCKHGHRFCPECHKEEEELW